ncbi:MAG: hypothetical protein ACPGF7_05600 [Pontibacterium sp.]
MKTELWSSKTNTPFVQGCMAGENSTLERCECLSKYVHKHFSDMEVQAIMDQRMEGAFAQKVNEVIRAGSQSCQTP